MRIKVIIPNANMDRETLDSREQMLMSVVSPGTIISVDCIKRGSQSIESHTDEVLSAEALLKQSIEAENENFDAIVVYCFSDLAIDAIRENLTIPVIGPGEVSLSIADMISNNFTVITTTETNIFRTERRLMKKSVVKEKMKSIRSLNIPVLELRNNSDITKKYLEKACIEAIEDDNVDTIVLGCLGMAQYGNHIKEHYGVQVIDPAFSSIAYAEMCVKLNISHSKKCYPLNLKRDML